MCLTARIQRILHPAHSWEQRLEKRTLQPSKHPYSKSPTKVQTMRSPFRWSRERQCRPLSKPKVTYNRCQTWYWVRSLISKFWETFNFFLLILIWIFVCTSLFYSWLVEESIILFIRANSSVAIWLLWNRNGVFLAGMQTARSIRCGK